MKFINLLGNVVRGSRQVSGTDNLRDEDIQDGRKLTELLRATIRRITSLEAKTPPEGTEFEVNVGADGETVRLSHGFNCPVRFQVVHWAGRTSETPPGGLGAPAIGIVARSCSIGTWTNLATAAPGQTNGCSFRLKRRRNVLGIRFIWRGTGARTMTCKLWNNTTGAVLASTTASVDRPGVYEARFSEPVTSDLTGTDITVSVYNSLQMTYSTDTVWKALVPMELAEDLKLVNQALFLAGDNRPTSTAGAGVSYVVEPILDQERTGPELVLDSSSDSNNLVLKSYVRGKAVIRVEPSQYTVSQ